MSAITADADDDARTRAAVELHADLSARRWLCVPLVLAGATEHLVVAARAPGDSALARAALLVLALLADTSCGLERLGQLGLLPWLAREGCARPEVAAAHAAASCRLLEVAAQHTAGAAQLTGAVPDLCAFVLAHHHAAGRGHALGALCGVLRNMPKAAIDHASALGSLKAARSDGLAESAVRALVVLCAAAEGGVGGGTVEVQEVAN
jgi:hypothetical protein